MYKGINYSLLMRYKKKLNSELQDLLCKDYGMYFGGAKFTSSDKIRYQVIKRKLRALKDLRKLQ